MMLGHIVRALAWLIHYLIHIYIFVIIIRSVISWMGNIPPSAFTRILRRLTDPVFRWVHKHIPFTIIGRIDISPIIIIVALYFLDLLIYNLLMDYVRYLKRGG
jgi:YggT family protein